MLNASTGHHSPDPLVSIITVVPANSSFFGEIISSVLRQTLQQWEWVIVNDGTADPAALATLQSLRERGDPRICVIDQMNRGLPAARNAAVTVTSAPLLFFLDSDDL